MSKNIKDTLFELIQSMTKSEKRYFKLLSSRHTIGEVNNYIVLFDYIDKMKEYDEQKVFDHFKGEAFLNSFSITKKRLYDHLLSSLDTFHSGSSVDAQLHKMLHSADILYKKSLYLQSERILRSAQKLAQKHQRFGLLMEISARRKKLIETNSYADTESSTIHEIYEDDLNNLSAIRDYTTLWNLKSELFMELSRKGISRNEDQRAAFDRIYKEIQEKFDPELLSVDSAYLYYHIASAYHYATNDFENCLSYLNRNIAMMEGDGMFIADHPNSFFSALSNAIYVSEKLHEYGRANSLLQKLKTFPQTYKIELSEDLQIKLFSSTSSIELSMLVSRGDFEAAARLIPVIERGLTLYKEKVTPQRHAFLAFKFAGIYMGTKNFPEALKWVNTILNNTDLDATEDIVAFTHILDLMIHLEMRHDQLLPYAIKSTQRYLKSRNRMYSFEKVMLRFISKLTKTADIFEDEQLWDELYNELQSIKSESGQGVALEYFDFESWAKSKVKRKDFTLVVKEKYGQLSRVG